MVHCLQRQERERVRSDTTVQEYYQLGFDSTRSASVVGKLLHEAASCHRLWIPDKPGVGSDVYEGGC
ncbi:hypothetical protein KC19_8G134200 [Ceratodon purpureus]|uniref:Uncharacterized protein n=1 Tax=Ceratodon purpureus TaxID=3225 RepID=A0A8T0H0T1_CERPU|nr:hypothetical protein KC19_8G134200 [Ceratodon purpureus]